MDSQHGILRVPAKRFRQARRVFPKVAPEELFHVLRLLFHQVSNRLEDGAGSPPLGSQERLLPS